MLHAGNYRLDYTGNAGALGLGTITITPSVKGTIVDLDNFETAGVNSVTGNIYDGDHIASVHTLLTVNGAAAVPSRWIRWAAAPPAPRSMDCTAN